MSQAPAVEPRRSASINRPPLKVLFLCTHNSARSQIAEGFARALAPSSVQVWSAGTEPRRVHPRAIEVMREVGIDLGGHTSKSLDQVPWQECDMVVTLCGDAAEACPALAAEVRRLHWPLPDPGAAPEAEQGAAFQETRDEIRWRVACLWPRSG